jgi:hypothetical protein
VGIGLESISNFSLNFKDRDGNDSFENIELSVKSLPPGQEKKGTGLQKMGLELLDLRSDAGNNLDVQITVNSEAAFDNFVGFYLVNENGDVVNNAGDVLAAIGSENYTQIAINQRLDLSLTKSITVFNTTIAGGNILAPFILSNDSNPNDGFDVNRVFFPFLGSNPDSSKHILLLGDNTFGFEDLPNGGDRDFDDIIVKIEFV